MNHHIAKQLNEVAATMPLVFVWETRPVLMKGWELNLTPLGEGVTFEKDTDYEIPVPCMVAVEHKQQIKDAYKRGGLPAVQAYHRQVMDKAKNPNAIKLQQVESGEYKN